MKWIRFIFILLLPLLSCTREVEIYEPDLDDVTEGRARITFSCSLPESYPATKALGETAGLQTLHLAVFGSSGHYKEYVQADLISHSTANKSFTDANGNPFEKTVDVYTFSASVQLSNTARTIHFIGNGPSSITIGKSADVLPLLLCNDPDDAAPKETAFWQMIYLPEIKAATDAQGNFLNPQGQIRQPGEDYQVDNETLACFQDVALVRNWSKIVLRNNWKGDLGELPADPVSHFTPISFAVVNVPSRGTIVPYGGKTGFIGPDKNNPGRNYQTLAFDELIRTDGIFAYNGNLPDGTAFNHTVPSKKDFQNGTGGVVKYNKNNDPQYSSAASENNDAEPAVYLYERPAPKDNIEPSYVIIYGTYKNADDPSLTETEKLNGVKCFYKVDLMADGEYYPILRNFKYQIQIRKITSRGYDDPKSAAESAGSADVSSDVSASHLADISDGTRRMAIRPWMSYTFFEGDPEYTGDPTQEVLPEHLYVKFYDDISTDLSNPDKEPVINMDASSVYAEIRDGSGVIKDNVVVIDPPHSEPGDDYGWRTIRFRVNKPDNVLSRTQTLRICCKTDINDHEEAPLYREIVLTLQPLQPMKVSCEYPRVLSYKGQPQQLNISIPDGLVESMFPLVFTVEPQDMTLTPDNSIVHLPVVYGKSINPNVPENDIKPRFQFERTVSWDEYRSQRVTVEFADESRWKTFSCYFKTNCVHSATDIWVANKYFYSTEETACASFTDYRSFDAAFTTGIPKAAGKDVSMQLGLDSDQGVYPVVRVRLTGLEWPGHTLAAGQDYYEFTPTADNSTLTFRTTAASGDVSVYVFSEGDSYEPATLVPWHFSNAGFVSTHALHSNWTGQWGSNAAFGLVNSVGDKNLLFGFMVDSGNPTPKIYLKDKVGVGSFSDEINLATFSRANYTGNKYYYWAEGKTSAGTTAASLTLGAAGYVEEEISAGRFVNGNIVSYRADANELKSAFQSSTTKTNINMDDKCKLTVEIIPKPDVSDNGLVFKAKTTYELIVRLYSNVVNSVEQPTTCELASVQLEYLIQDGVPQIHRTYEIDEPEESRFYLYPGHGSEYIWDFPRGCQKGVITFTAPNGRDAVVNVLRVWGFKQN